MVYPVRCSLSDILVAASPVYARITIISLERQYITICKTPKILLLNNDVSQEPPYKRCL